MRSQADTIPIDERNFEHPNEFIPERWTSKPELTKNASVYSPFSIGKYSLYIPNKILCHTTSFLACISLHSFNRSV